MRCHYCEREADLMVERAGIRVGLCPEHFRTRLIELAEHWPTSVAQEIES